MTKVKICGITNLEDARYAIDRGADELGFNFYAGSKRYVSPENASEIIKQLPATSRSVGVFVNEPIDNLLAISNMVGLKAIQVHGYENRSYFTDLRKATDRSVIKAFRVTPTFDIGDVVSWDCDFQLFDTYSANQYGGTGIPIDWKDFSSQVSISVSSNSYIAGGLTPENVAEAVKAVYPYAVDVASGVESEPGKKDPKKVEAFIQNAKNA